MPIVIPKPKRDVFRNKKGTVVEHVFAQRQPQYFRDESVFPMGEEYPEEGGIFRHMMGGTLKPIAGEPGNYELQNAVKLLYPEPGYPTAEACNANNIAKRALLRYIIVVVGNWPHLLSLVFKKNVFKVFSGINAIAWVVLEQFILEDKRYQKPVREIRKFLESFMKEFGFPPRIVWKSPLLITTMLEYDNAYLLRVQDILTETTKEALMKNPRKEIKRLTEIFLKRDHNPGEKMKILSKLINKISLALLVPSVRRSFNKALSEIDLTKIQMDEATRYHILRWGDGYDFLGTTGEDRWEEFNRVHNGNPPRSYALQS